MYGPKGSTSIKEEKIKFQDADLCFSLIISNIIWHQRRTK